MPWIVAGSVAAGMVLMLVLAAATGGLHIAGRSDGGQAQASYGDDRVVSAAAKVRPAVVSVISTFKAGEKNVTATTAIGSGIVFEKKSGKARIVTNSHVVEGASNYEVVLFGGGRKTAALLGKDEITDLAVLEVDASGIDEPAVFGDSERLQPGETAISIGNPLGLNYALTVTVGVISSPKVTIPYDVDMAGGVQWEMDLIQTDAAINQGNSGGALVSLDGKVIGINSLKMADTGVEGLGFAIPINEAKPIIEKLIADQKISRPFIGVSTAYVQSFPDGAAELELPAGVKAGAVVMKASGPAKNAGLQPNDVIVQMDDHAIDSPLELRKYLYNEKKVGDRLKITYYRAGDKASVTVVLEELEDAE